jgi:Tol biopolymer transport system component
MVHIGGEKLLFTKKLEVKMNCKKTVALCMAIGLILGNYQALAQTAEELLSRGIHLEEVKGELEKAIEVYQTIVDKFSDNRPIAAKALLHIGLCYEKLGQEEALRAYRKLINEYSEQSMEVKTARERLAGLISIATVEKPNFRRIRVPTKLPRRGSGKLSPDGQKLVFISEGSVWVLPVHGKSDPDIAGMPVRLTESMHAWDIANVSIEWSAEGKWIGFRVAVPKEDQNAAEELYIVPTEGGIPKRLPLTWKDWAGDVYTLRYALSSDANTIYFADGSQLEQLCIYRMNAKSGKKTPITKPITRKPALSPDGSNLAYVRINLGPDGNPEAHQVWMKPLDGGEPVLVCKVTGKTWLASPIWSPDGNMIAFLSSVGRGGNRHHQIWVVVISPSGKPGSPIKFELPGQTSNLLAGWTHDNSIGILVPTEQRLRLYTVPASGGKATQLTTAYTCMPVWAPDNKRIYFDGCHGGDYASLEYIAAEGGKATRISVLPENLQPVFPSELAISKDGSKLLFAGFYRYGEAEPAGHLFTVSVEGGTVTPLKISNTNWTNSPSMPEWSPDETQIAFIAGEEVKPDFNVYNIFVMPAAGGEPRQISSQEDQISRGTIAWSPDGDLIAFYGQDKTIRLIPANGGSSRVLVSKVGRGIPWSGIAWSPDGKQIAYTAGGDLHVVSRDGGKPKLVQTGLDAHHLKIDWSDDGKHIAFTASQGGEPELWLMEDFLPE